MPGALDLTAGASPRKRTGGVCVRFGRKGYDVTTGSPKQCDLPVGCDATTPEICWSEGQEGEGFGSSVQGWTPSGNGRFFLAVGAPGSDVQSDPAAPAAVA